MNKSNIIKIKRIKKSFFVTTKLIYTLNNLFRQKAHHKFHFILIVLLSFLLVLNL